MIVGPDSSSDPDELESDADDGGRAMAGGWRLKGGAEVPVPTPMPTLLLPLLPIRADGGRGESGSARNRLKCFNIHLKKLMCLVNKTDV